MKIRCNRCGFVGDESDFPKGRDFFQSAYVCACPLKCGNRQGPGGAAMRGFGGDRPFSYVREDEPSSIVGAVEYRMSEAS